MTSEFEDIYRCQRLLRICVIAVLMTFWVPYILLAVDVFDNRHWSNVLSGILLGGPLVVMVATLILSVQFLRAIPDSALGKHWPMLLLAFVTAIPFFNVLGPLCCLQQVQSFLGREPGVLPTSLPRRRCRCGERMTLVGGIQWRKLLMNVPTGYVAKFTCGRCSRQIEIPSPEMMILNVVSLPTLALLLVAGWAWVLEFVREPAPNGPGLSQKVLSVTVALGISALVIAAVIRLIRQLISRLLYPEATQE